MEYNKDKWQEFLLRDIKNIRERIEAQRQALLHSMSRLEKDADNCWENANAEERYFSFVDKMNMNTEAQKALEPLLVNIESLEQQIRKLLYYDEYQYPVYTWAEQRLSYIMSECEEFADEIFTKICKRAIKTINSWGRSVLNYSDDYPAKFTVFDILSIELQSKFYCELGMFLQDAIEEALEYEYDNLSAQEKFFINHSEDYECDDVDRETILKRIFDRFNEMWNEHYQLKKIQDFEEKRLW